MNLHIEDSYDIDIERIVFLTNILYDIGKLGNKRSVKSYIKEWYAHNVLYKMHLFRKHTKDVDLNDDESLFRRACYSVIWFCSFRWLKY